MSRPADLRPLAAIAAEMLPYNVWAQLRLALPQLQDVLPPPHQTEPEPRPAQA